MAKIVIAGKAVVVTSTMKLEDIKTVGKYRPDALVLKGGEDGKEPIFALKAGNTTSSINKYGACFTDETRDEKLATLTMTTNYDGDDIEGFVADELGTALTCLGKLEEMLPEVLESIAADRAAIISNITFVE